MTKTTKFSISVTAGTVTQDLLHQQTIKPECSHYKLLLISNLSLQNFQAFKQINVLSYFRGIVPNWKLSFSLCYPFKAFANIHYSPDDSVHGVIMRLTQKDLDKLCRLELSYRLQTVTAYSYEDRTNPIEVNTFIFDKQCEHRILKEIK